MIVMELIYKLRGRLMDIEYRKLTLNDLDIPSFLRKNKNKNM